MAEPFDTPPADGGGLRSRVLGRRARTSAGREIEELLARAGRVTEVSAAQVADIASRHGVDLARRLGTPCRNLYRRYLEFCLLDQALSEDEIADLAHLRVILALEDEEAARVHDEAACSVYGSVVERVLADHRLDPEEESFLRRLRDDLRLREAEAARLLHEGAQRARYRYLSRVAAQESVLVEARETVLELAGTSEHTVEEAVGAAITEACAALPELREVTLADVRAEVSGGRIARWHVTVRATVPPSPVR